MGKVRQSWAAQKRTNKRRNARQKNNARGTATETPAAISQRQLPSGRQPAPGGRNTTKHRGDAAEMQFMIEASHRGFGVAKPFGDNERYDIILDAGAGRLWRVQVKASGATHHRGFTVRSCWRTSHRPMPYTVEQIDFLAVMVHGRAWHDEKTWYLIPTRALGGRLTIHLYPNGSRRGSSNRFEEYREAWHLLDPEAPTDGGPGSGLSHGIASAMPQAHSLA
jgi:hypothetical protein